MPECGDCTRFDKGYCEKGMINGQIPPKHPSCERFEQILEKIDKKFELSEKSEIQESCDVSARFFKVLKD